MLNPNKLFPRLSIRWKLIIGFVLMGVVPSLVAGAFGVWSTISGMEQAVLENIRNSVVTKAEDVQAFVSRVEGDVLFLSRLPTVQGLANAVPGGAEHARWDGQVGEAFLAFSRAQEAYYQVRYLDASGMETVRVDLDGARSRRIPRAELQDKSGRYYFMEGMQTPVGQVYVSSMDLNIERGVVEVPHKPVVRFATVVTDRAGRRRGLVIINVYATYILRRVQELRGIERGVVFLADRDGFYLSRSDRIAAGGDYFGFSPEDTLERDFSPAVAKQILSARSGTVASQGRIVAYAPVITREQTRGTFWVVGHTYSRREVFAGVRTTEAMVVGFGLLVLLVAVGAGVLGARQLTGPILELSRSAEIITGGNFEHRIQVETNDELEDLSHQFNRMAGHLKEHEQQLLAARERAERKAQEAEALNRVGIEVLSLLSLPQILQLVVDKARQLLKVDLAILCLDARGDGLRLEAVSGATEHVRLRPGDLVPAPTCEKVVCHDVSCPAVLGASFSSHVAVAMRSGDRVVGNLCVASRGPRAVTPDELEFLSGLANQATIAIENARLHREVRDLARLEERERIAQDLHDGIIQSIYATGLSLEECAKLPDEEPREVRAKVTQAIQGLNRVIRDVRNYVVGLQPEGLQEGGLGRALADLTQGLALNALLDAELEVEPGIDESLSPDQTSHLFQISREALTNVVKHAGASRVVLTLARLSGIIRLSIVDDGTGFDPDHPSVSGRGLRNMEERARRLGGKLRIESRPGRGTRITVEVPQEEAA